jgi:hypothetical protein
LPGQQPFVTLAATAASSLRQPARGRPAAAGPATAKAVAGGRAAGKDEAMAHRMLDATVTTRQELERLLKDVEEQGLNVVALGSILEPRLIVRDGPAPCEHLVVAVTGRDDATLGKILRQRERDGWVVCGLGPCADATVLIFKRVRSAS